MTADMFLIQRPYPDHVKQGMRQPMSRKYDTVEPHYNEVFGTMKITLL